MDNVLIVNLLIKFTKTMTMSNQMPIIIILDDTIEKFMSTNKRTVKEGSLILGICSEQIILMSAIAMLIVNVVKVIT